MFLHMLRDETCELQLGVFFSQSRGLHALRLFPGEESFLEACIQGPNVLQRKRICDWLSNLASQPRRLQASPMVGRKVKNRFVSKMHSVAEKKGYFKWTHREHKWAK